MTAFLLLLALIVVVELVAGVRALRDRPAAPPASHADWTWGNLPSAPYSTSH